MPRFGINRNGRKTRPRKKSQTPQYTYCKFCLKCFKNIGLHFYQNKICYDFNKGDLTLVANATTTQPTSTLTPPIINF